MLTKSIPSSSRWSTSNRTLPSASDWCSGSRAVIGIPLSRLHDVLDSIKISPGGGSVREGFRSALGQLTRMLATVFGWQPRIRVGRVLESGRCLGHVERMECVDHHRELLRRFPADRRLDGAGMGPVGN